MGEQVKNGKAFEYALAFAYSSYLTEKGVDLELVEDNAFINARDYYNQCSYVDRRRFDYCAALTIGTITKVEPGLTVIGNDSQKLRIFVSPDEAGEAGDVRDVVFKRANPTWEIGFSAKNNNDAVKHSRLSGVLDFGESWFGVNCSQRYWNEIRPIFDYTTQQKNARRDWNDLGEDKQNRVYLPLLEAFRKELLFINDNNDDIPQKLISYLIGRFPFYKIIKDDTNNLVVVKAFNIEGKLNQSYNRVRPRFKTPPINLPTRIVEFKMKPDSDNTLHMILDGGWEISFRIHNASTKVESSLKFDIKLLGNPPVLFTQYLFQENEID